MKYSFNRFAVRYLLVLGLGLVLLTLHGAGGLGKVLAPQFAGPWELSKLGYWPMLGALALSGAFREGGRVRCSALVVLVLTPAAIFLLSWLFSALDPEGGIYLVTWLVCVTLGAALAERCPVCGRQGSIWLVLAVAWAALYVIFAFFPPAVGPFLDPAAAAAMAPIPC